MPPRPTCARIAATFLVALAAPFLHAQGFTPDEAVKRMKVPDGFAVSVTAAEPLVRQPVAIDFDDRGRLWVIQYLQYPNPAGLKRVKVDRYSRTAYDKVPDPPPKGPRGADRITILEDVDGDGRADRAKDFVDGLNLASGFAFGHGGVFVLQVPYLLFYPDQNRDDIPDTDPEVLLSGFGMEDAHSVANSLMFGPDGWLYGCQGSTVTANIRGVEFQQGVWRYHPRTKTFELFCEGGGNSWGLDFDARGNLLYSTNLSPYRMLHAVQGGYYWKMFGKHGELHNPYAYGYIDHIPHDNFSGGHVTVGGMIYQSDALPERYRGRYVAADLLGHQVWWNDLTPVGSSFKSSQAETALEANDTWFAPSDLTIGPDGAVYVADWSDQRTAHPDPDAQWDRSNGRVYRMAWEDAKRGDVPDVARLSSAELVERLSSANQWLARRARNELAHRRDPAVIPLLRKMPEGSDELQALWALYVSGGFDDAVAEETLAHRDADVRRWTVRFLGDAERTSDSLTQRLVELAASEPDVTVRSQLASTARRLPAQGGLRIVAKLAIRDEDASDPHIPLLLWWAVEPHAISQRDAVLAIMKSPAIARSSLARNAIAAKLMRRWSAEGSEAGLEACAELLAVANDKRPLVVGFNQGWSEQTSPPKTMPRHLVDEIRSLWTRDTTDVAVITALCRLGLGDAQQRATTLAMDATLPAELRVAMIPLLGTSEDLLALIDQAQPEPVQLAAIGAMQSRNDLIAGVLERLEQTSEPVRRRGAEILITRQSSAAALLRAIDAGEFPASLLAVDQVRPIAVFKDTSLDALVKKHWGSVRGPTPEEKLADVRRLNNDLRAASGDAAAGRVLYQKNCGICHKLFNDGADVGPDLTHANRADRDYLLVSIVDPSTVVRAEHTSYVLETTDGQVLTGLIAEQSPAGVTLKNASNVRTTVERGKIKAMRESPLSLMPEGLMTPLKPQEVRDLFAYLQSNQPPPAGD